MPENGSKPFIKIGPVSIPQGVWTDCPRPVKVALYSLAVVVLALVGWQRYGAPVVGIGEYRMSKMEAAQLIESRRHFWEAPEDEFQIDGGQGEVRHYASDHCSVIVWTMADGSQRPIFALHPEREAAMDVDLELEILRSGAAGIVPVGSCPGPGPGCCIDPHPPPWEEKVQPLDDCLARVWRRFQDGCLHYQDTDCTGRWGPVVWRECYH
jgi:hypothetical protein